MIGAGAAILGSFAARLGMDTTDYTRGIINADSMNRIFGQSFTAFVSEPLLGSIGIIKNAGAAFLRYSGELLGTAERVQRLGEVTGATSELIQALEQRLDLAGHGADRARQALIKLAQNASNGHAAFEELGIDLTKIGSTDHLLERTVEALSQLRREGDRTALAMALMGEEAGPALLNAIGGGADALARMKQEAIDLGLVMDNSVVRTLADFNTTIGFGKQAIEGLKLTVVSNFLAGFAGEFDKGTGSIREMVAELNSALAPAARDVGEAVADIVGDLDEVIDKLNTILSLVEPTARGISGVSTLKQAVENTTGRSISWHPYTSDNPVWSGLQGFGRYAVGGGVGGMLD